MTRLFTFLNPKAIKLRTHAPIFKIATNACTIHNFLCRITSHFMNIGTRDFTRSDHVLIFGLHWTSKLIANIILRRDVKYRFMYF